MLLSHPESLESTIHDGNMVLSPPILLLMILSYHQTILLQIDHTTQNFIEVLASSPLAPNSTDILDSNFTLDNPVEQRYFL